MKPPKSSPARTTTRDEYYPPSLIMFPRSKSSSRAIRSRATPMFINKIKINNETNQEPLSPKVTCMGQVKVNRSNKNKTRFLSLSLSLSSTLRRCKMFQRVWRGRISCFRCHCYKRSKKLNEPVSNETFETGDVMGACKDELIAGPSPRTAVLLTRSRSAPYRISGEGDESRKRVGKEYEDIINGDEEFKANVKVKPMYLSRCKSEPARTGDKVFMSFSFSA